MRTGVYYLRFKVGGKQIRVCLKTSNLRLAKVNKAQTCCHRCCYLSISGATTIE